VETQNPERQGQPNLIVVVMAAVMLGGVLGYVLSYEAGRAAGMAEHQQMCRLVGEHFAGRDDLKAEICMILAAMPDVYDGPIGADDRTNKTDRTHGESAI